MSGDRRRPFSSLVLARRGSPIPAVPRELVGFVWVERVEGMNTHEVPVKSYDEWLVFNAKAGFTGRGSLRLRDKKGHVVTWISGRDMQNIIGIDGNGALKCNHRVCFQCGQRAIFHGDYFDEKQQCKITMFKCTKCGEIKKFSKRPASHSAKKHNQKQKPNQKPKLIRNHPPNVPLKVNRG